MDGSPERTSGSEGAQDFETNADLSDGSTTIAEKCDCEPTREVRFAFGPDGDYFMSTSDANVSSYRYRLKSGTAKQLESSHINQVLSAAIVPDGGIIFIHAGRSSSDGPSATLTYAGPQGYASAFEIVFNKIFRKVASGHLGSVADASKIILTVGPGGSYFTPSKDNPIWRDIPTALDAKINASEIEPRQVALGRNNAWVCLWADHTISYSLGTEYSDLADRLQRYMQTNDRVAFVALDPYDNDSWFLVDCDGLISWAFRNMKYNEISGIQEMAGDYMQRRARKTGATFSYTNTSGAGTKRVDITPQTVHDKHDSGSSKILPGPLSDQWLAMRRRLPPVQWRRNNVIASSAAAVSTATACGLMGMKMRPALAVGGIAGVVTLALTSTDLIA